jgi:uncharacterized protein
MAQHPAPSESPDGLTADLIQHVRANPELMQVLSVVRSLRLPDWRIVAGAVYQTVWNARTGRQPTYGIKDFDVVYFDGSDLSWDAEDVVIRRVQAAFDAALRDRVEVRNQARVHLWFKDHFGEDYAPLPDTDTMITRFVSPAFAVGIRLEPDDEISVFAPFGLEDLFAMKLRPNPHRPLSSAWDSVVAKACARWPEIEVIRPGA